MLKVRNPNQIISDVENEYGLEEGTLASRKRSPHVSEARKDAITRMRAAGYSWSDICDRLSRDRSTIIMLIRRSRNVILKSANVGKSVGITRAKTVRKVGKKIRAKK